MDNDDFFEYFRTKDISQVKRFDFGKWKAGKSSQNAEVKPNGPVEPQKSSSTSATLECSSKGKNKELPLNGNDTAGRFTSCTTKSESHEVLLANKALSPKKKFTFKPISKGEGKTEISTDKPGHSALPVPKIGQHKVSSPSTPQKKKFNFKQLQKPSSPVKTQRSDNILDSLYKSTSQLAKKNPSQSSSSPSQLNSSKNLKTSKYFTEDESKSSPVAKPKQFKSVHSSQPKLPGSTSHSSTTSNSSTLNLTDADYMDDEEFERKFGSLVDQLEPSTTPQEKPEKPDGIEELLKEISTVNWEEDVFDEEPVLQGFKDREDDSAEFQGAYEHSEVMREVLQEKFGLRNFRPHQKEIINASLMQKDCFVLMPTGGGKSLCYQLPAILMPGVTVVISPLRALISDQVDKLMALDIAAAHLCSDVSKSDSDQIYMKLSMREPAIKLLYLTPEKINSSRAVTDCLNSLYQRDKLARFVVDEVHCLSQWGHDFRPDYKQLSNLRRNYPKVPIICLTATATKQVENDVVKILQLTNVKRFIRSFNRPNIKYEVIPKKGKSMDEIAELIKSGFAKQSGIVYCLSRDDCEKLADQFIKMGVRAKPYHAGMSDKVREAIQREWMQDRFHVIVATIAFGMGIDKPDVRFVIHNSIPKSVEAFYQESGRAGRDGEVSYSYLFYSYSDVIRLRRLMLKDAKKSTMDAYDENLQQMVSFAENTVDCRRYLQLIHLGEHFDRRICIQNKSTTCDNCCNIDRYKTVEVTEQAKQLCTILKDLSAHENVTMTYVVEVFKGAKTKKIISKGHDKHPLHGSGSAMDKNDLHRILVKLSLNKVVQDFCTYAGDFPVVYVKPGPKFYQFYNSKCQLTISVCTDKSRKFEPVAKTTPMERTKSKSQDAPSTSKVVPHSVQKQNVAKLQAARKLQLSQLKVQCHEELLEECRRLAMDRNLTLSSIMNLSAIKSMSDYLPKSKEEMLKIQHVTVANYNKYGEYFLKITQAFREKHDAIAPLTAGSGGVAVDVPEEEENEDGAFKAYSPPKKSGGRGVKRKSGWGGKKGGYKRKKAGGKKSPSKGKSTGWKSKKGSGGKLGLMPLHVK